MKASRQRPRFAESGPEDTIRWLLYAYFILLLCEGALRKWILPELSAPLLVARDPIAVMIILLAVFRGYWPVSGYRAIILLLGVGLAVIGMVQLFTIPEMKWPVIVFGWRTYMLHLPVIFIGARVLVRQDLVNLCRWCCGLALPMVVMCYIQYYAGGDSLWNTGTGRDTVQIAFEGEKVRASGTFSFSTGSACFFSLVAAFALSQIGAQNISTRNRRISYLALGACVAFMPVSGSRLALYMIGMVLLCGTVRLLNPRQLGYLLIALVAIYGISHLPYFSDAVESMTTRMESSRMVEDEEMKWGFWSRVISGFRVPFDIFEEIPKFIGLGLGLGTNVGAALVGTDVFLLGESEWQRILGECGWYTGMAYILFRIWLALDLLILSFLAVKVHGDWLPLLLWSAGAWTAVQGQLGQPTNLGFFVINIMSVMVALKFPNGLSAIERGDERRLFRMAGGRTLSAAAVRVAR